MSGTWMAAPAGNGATSKTLTIWPPGLGRPKSSVVPAARAKAGGPANTKSGPTEAASGLSSCATFHKPQFHGQPKTTLSRVRLVTLPQGPDTTTLYVPASPKFNGWTRSVEVLM